VHLVDIPERHGFDSRTLRRLAAEVREFRPDILHAHDYKTNLLAVLLGRWFGVRVMTTLHGYGFGGGRLAAYYQLDRWTLRAMDHVVAVSEGLFQRLIDWRVPAERRSLVFNGIDTDQFARRQSVRQAREKMGWSPDRFLIGAVGRLTAVKGFDLLIQAADQLLGRGLDLELVIVGDGEERVRLQELIGRLGRTDRIHLLGHQSEVQGIFEALDVFALSSLSEGLPNVLLEALALEVPVAATGVGAVPRVIAHEGNGLLLEPGSVGALAEALARLLNDPDLRRRLGQAGRAAVQGQFSFAARMEKIRAIYDRILNTRAGNGLPASRLASLLPL
jgi:glycosyltransferase involved in cell wall biosynthesis